MNLREYQIEALRTANLKGDPNLRLAVAGLGLAGESAEVLELVTDAAEDTEKMVKELGDLMWYVADTASAAGIALDMFANQVGDSRKEGFGVLTTRLVIQTGLLADYLKKVVGHSHPLDQKKISDKLGGVVRTARGIADCCGTDLSTVCHRNIEKLRARYPAGWDASRSLHRAEGDV